MSASPLDETVDRESRLEFSKHVNMLQSTSHDYSNADGQSFLAPSHVAIKP